MYVLRTCDSADIEKFATVAPSASSGQKSERAPHSSGGTKLGKESGFPKTDCIKKALLIKAEYFFATPES